MPPDDQPGHVDVEHAHQHEGDADQREDRLRAHVALGAAHGFGGGAAAAQFGERLGQAGDQVLAHAEQRVAGAHHHAAHRDRPHDEAPHGVARPSQFVRLRAGRQEGVQLRTEEEDQQRNQQAPGDHAAGEIERRQFRPDDVADAEERRADRGPGDTWRRRPRSAPASIRAGRAAACCVPVCPTLKKKF